MVGVYFQGGMEVKIEVIGRQTLILMDNREYDGGRFDLLLTDPPYGIGISSNPVRQAHDKKSWDNEAPNISRFIDQCDESIVWGGNYFDLPPSRGFIIWDKVQPQSFSLAMCEYAWRSKDCNAKIYKKRVVGCEKLHPTQKPVDLMQYCLIEAGLPKTVFDPFMGSGTTLVACEKENISGTGIEVDPQYFDVACSRVEDATRQGGLL